MWKEADRFLKKDKYIGPLLKKYGPCTLQPRKKSEYFEDLVDAVVQQQLSIKAGATIFGRLKEALGGEVTPEEILRLKDAKIRECGLSFSKISYLKDLSKKVKDNEVETHKLDKLTDEAVMEELVSVKGIGRWTAEMFLMFDLARPDIFPADDVGIQNGFKKLTGKNIKPDKMGDFARRWAPYRTIASWYIWRSLENG
ncbi:DNA-3-methyladenine glycosylase 2 family protein [Candidatus Saccharibacteria bacterium]|nr:DNA-3-methyladenine glycosylase 2 family protein [Candidatus Saccharibacteria bacterium]